MTASMVRPARGAFGSVLMMLVLTALAGCSFKEEQKVWEISGPIFGTQYQVQVVLEEDRGRLEQLSAGITESLEFVDASMSTWRDDSELSRFNEQSDQTEWFEVSAELIQVIRRAEEISVLTDGAFDITIGPVVNLWGFGPEMRPEQQPTDDELAQRLAQVGYQQLEWKDAPPSLRAMTPQRVDLSAIAKGYAVDRLALYLESEGISAYLVEIGGEVRVSGRKPDGDAWRLAIEEPAEGARQINRVVALTQGAIATSGDYRNYYESGGRRLSHTIDPETGRPITHTLASVTVISDDCMTADGLATAFNVMGKADAMALATRENIAAYFISRNDDGFAVDYTPAFSSYLAQ